ncbi:3-hydroxyisobutyrate dehydrogenase [Friedmanniella endophytica]|uniref:3-hydroxyisobutyrate dehydrogenase n=1 Tax=Microlunatus kandeliicorticis TaxID=1759536 RepID=A0A7W3ITT9_9ACTN|nr:NAD(P)-dependent oxidoreductase [Microlunatus kandeliicorticis]MBA8795122.1 3-hydroxyisobutyrate dehydrogenase [Microlunatus kandeliicorticis]
MLLGFLGLGLMGEPMATNLVRAGRSVLVWNRSAAAAERLAALGAEIAADAAEVVQRADVTLVMLADASACDQVLGHRNGRVTVPVAGRVLVQCGTVSPAYSAGLAAAVARSGGRYVEAPVSGSRGPAERGELVAMLAGEPEAVRLVRPLLGPIAATVVECGAVPQALSTKLAVNTFLITMVTGLAESVRLAEASGLDLATVAAVLDAGPMASVVSRGKLAKLLADDLAPQAAVADVHRNAELIVAAAEAVGVRLPLAAASRELFAEAVGLGRGGEDMIAVIEALRAR